MSKFRDIRKELGMTQKEVAGALGFCERHVRRIEEKGKARRGVEKKYEGLKKDTNQQRAL